MARKVMVRYKVKVDRVGEHEVCALVTLRISDDIVTRVRDLARARPAQ